MRRRIAALSLAAAGALSILPAVADAMGGTTMHLSAMTMGMGFNTKQIVVARPGTVTLIMRNPSPVLHNVAIRGGGLRHPVLGKVVGKGGISRVTTTLRKGTYQFYCSVPGHAQAGMRGPLTVK